MDKWKLCLLVAFLAWASPARAMTWRFLDDCSPFEQQILVPKLTEAETAVTANFNYALKMTGKNQDSFDYLYWIGGWVVPFPTIAKLGASNLEMARRVGVASVSCHDQDPNMCDGATFAWTYNGKGDQEFSLKFCDFFWHTPQADFHSTVVHEMSHWAIDAGDDMDTTSFDDARRLVILGVNDSGYWLRAVKNAWNWEAFIMATYRTSLGGGCQIGHGRAPANGFGFLAVFVGAILLTSFGRRQTMKKVIGALVVLAGTYGSSVRAEPLAKGIMTCEIVMEKAPSVIILRITNHGSEPIRMTRRDSAWQPAAGTAGFSVFDRNTEETRTGLIRDGGAISGANYGIPSPAGRVKWAKRTPEPREKNLVIAPGETITSPPVDLAKWWDIPAGGFALIKYGFDQCMLELRPRQ